MRLEFLYAVLIACGLYVLPATAQHCLPDTLRACALNGTNKIEFDGQLNDSMWRCAAHISNFTQQELNFGEPSTEKTEVAVLYDRYALYVGVWAWMKDAKRISAKYMQRDFDYESDDNFQVIISPFNDKKNGYLYVINPNGARADMLVYGGEDGNQDWNGVWDCRTTRTAEGWFAEIRIPFTSLQFSRENLNNWAINFERDIQAYNERTFWQGWSRDYSIFSVANAGTLCGLDSIVYSKRFEFKPYGLAGGTYNAADKNDYQLKAGADLNVNLSPTLKLNLTTNTDFAQVEADRLPVNLTRFNLYYPEKREFFLEGYNNYQFYIGNGNEAFYTRRIGIEGLNPVPVLGGARVFGKVGKSNIGFLDIATGKADSIPPTNNTAFRYKYDLGEQSYIGCLFTSKINSHYSNQVYGIDGGYTTSKFFGKRNLTLAGLVSASMDNGKMPSNNLAYRLYLDYPNDLIDYFMAVSSVQQHYHPESGFLERSNFNAYTTNFRFTPRWFTRFGIKKLLLKPWELTVYATQSTGKLESYYNESRPLGAELKSGEIFELNLQQSFDRLDDSFDVTGSAVIPAGKYYMHRTEFYFSSFQARRAWVELNYNWGTYYTGKINGFSGGVGVNINRHFNVKGTYDYNYVVLPQSSITANEVALYSVFAFNPRTDISFFGQWNSLDDLLRFNLRFHWIPSVGQDLYVVLNEGYDQLRQLEIVQPQTITAAAKFVYRITF